LQEKFLQALMSGGLQLPPPHVLPFAAALSAAGGIGAGYPAAAAALGSLPYPVFPGGLPHPPPPPPPGLGPPPPGLGPLHGPPSSSRAVVPPLAPLSSSSAYHGGFQPSMTSSHAPADCISADGQPSHR